MSNAREPQIWVFSNLGTLKLEELCGPSSLLVRPGDLLRARCVPGPVVGPCLLSKRSYPFRFLKREKNRKHT